MMHSMIVKAIEFVGITGMHKTGCSGETCTYLARLELDSVIIIIIVVKHTWGQGSVALHVQKCGQGDHPQLHQCAGRSSSWHTRLHKHARLE